MPGEEPHGFRVTGWQGVARAHAALRSLCPRGAFMSNTCERVSEAPAPLRESRINPAPAHLSVPPLLASLEGHHDPFGRRLAIYRAGYVRTDLDMGDGHGRSDC